LAVTAVVKLSIQIKIEIVFIEMISLECADIFTGLEKHRQMKYL
jgi:hypothetical protein